MLVYSLLHAFLFNCVFSQQQNFDELLTEVREEISKSKNYVLPKNNFKLLETSDPTLYNYGTFDFIIVGSGAAGCVVANRLSEINSWKILLLEAGGEDDDVTDIIGLSYLYSSSDKNWGYNTTSSNTLCQGMLNHSCSYPRGKVRGGSTTINDCIYSRGHPEDYDLWASLGSEGWSYKDVLPYFKKSEHADFPNRDPESSGTEGYLHVNYTPSNPALENVLTQGFEELGFKHLEDYNSKKQIGISKAQCMINYNVRESSSRAFLDTVSNRKNLEVSLKSFVTKILINHANKRAYGIEFVKDGKHFIATAKNEVILSAGVINTPQILMLSGIGPQPHLKDLGISTLKDLPVGKNMGDSQWFKAIIFRSDMALYNFTLEEDVKRYLEGLKPFASRVEMINFINLKNKTESRADLEFYVAILGGQSNNSKGSPNLNEIYSKEFTLDSAHDLVFSLILMHPKTRSEVTLKSNSPLDFPNILANGLSDPDDMETMYRGVQYAIALNNTEAFKNYRLRLRVPEFPTCDKDGPRFSKPWWYCAFRVLANQGSHGVGTSRMGNDTKTSVVNSKLQVHGIKGLRVVDGSVIPITVSGHPTAPVIMVGEKGSDIIKKDYNKI